MKIRMTHDNCECWKIGDIFDVKRHYDGSLYIKCNYPEADGHALITRDGEDIFDLKDYDEGVEVK